MATGQKADGRMTDGHLAGRTKNRIDIQTTM